MKKIYANCHSHEKPREARQINVMWNPGYTPKTEKGHYVKTKEIWIKYELLVNIMHQYWFINCDKCTILMTY